MIEGTKRTKDESRSKCIGQCQNEGFKFLPLAMKAYWLAVHSVTKDSPAFVVLGYLLSLPNDCIYSTPHPGKYATSSDFVFTFNQKLQETHQFMREFMDVEQERRKTYYDCSRYGAIYNIGEEVIVFNQTVKKAIQENLLLSIENHTQ